MRKALGLVALLVLAVAGCSDGVCRVDRGAAVKDGTRIGCQHTISRIDCSELESALPGVTTKWMSRDDGDPTGSSTCARIVSEARAEQKAAR